MANSFELHIKTSADLKSVQQLKQELQEVKKLANEGYGTGEDISKIQSTIKSANTLEHAIQAAFDPKIETINIEKFNKTLKDSGTNIGEISHNLLNAGAAGQQAFLTMSNNLTSMGTATKQTNKVIERMATTFKNTVSWGISSGLWNEAVNTAQQAYGYVKSLDSSLNDIRIVTGKSADEMQRFGTTANETAKQLGVATSDFTEGALIYFQQGLDEETSTKLAEVTAKAANVTGQSMKATSEELTAVWNGYGVAAENAEQSVDILAAVASASASDLQELATSMSKVASAANAMGVGEDQLAAQLSTIISVTRQAPESVGTALKTIYARMTSIQAGTDEEGVSLGQYTEKMAQMGINVLDANNKLRDMGEVIEEVGGKWSNMSREQQIALAQTMAGTRQYNNLIALFDNFDQYNEMVDVAANSTGTLEEQQAIYLESITAKTEKLRTTFEDLYDSLFDEDSIKDTLDAVTGLVQLVADLTDSIGGLKNILPIIGALGVKVFKDQIGEGIGNAIGNSKSSKAAVARNQKEQQQLLFNLPNEKEFGNLPTLVQNAYKKNLNLISQISELNIDLSKEQIQQIENIKNQNVEIGKLSLAIEDFNDKIKDSKENYLGIDTELQTQLKDIKSVKIAWNENTKALSDFNTALKAIQLAKDSNIYSEDIVNTEKLRKLSYADRSENQQLVLDIIPEVDTDKIKKLEESIKDSSSLEELQKNYQEAISEVEKLKATLNDSKNADVLDSVIADFGTIKNEVGKVIPNIVEFKEQLKIGDIIQDDEGGKSASEKIDRLVDRFTKLTLEGKNVQDVFSEMEKDLTEAGVGAEQLQNYYSQLVGTMSSVATDSQNMSKALSFKDALSNVTNVVGAMWELYAAMNAFKNLGDVWSDEDLSTGEKIEQTLINLAMIIPMVVGYFKTLSDVKGKDSIATIANTLAENLNAAAKERTAKANEKAAEKQKEETATDIADTTQEAIGNVVNAGSNKKGGTKEALGKLGSALGNFMKSGGGIKGLVKSLVGSFGILKTVLGGLGIAFTVASVAQTAYNTYLKKSAENAKEAAEAAKEKASTAKNEADQVQQLSSSYNELKDQYDSQQISLNTLRAKTYELCEEQNRHDLAVKALSASYKELDAIMNKANYDSAKKASEEANNAYNAQVKALEKQTRAESKIVNLDKKDGKETIDLKGMYARSSTEEDFSKALEDLGINFTNNDHMVYSDFIRVYANNKEELLKLLEETNTKAADQLKQLIQEQKPDLDSISEQNQIAIEQQIAAVGSQKAEDISNIQSTEDYSNVASDMASQMEEYYKSLGWDEGKAKEQGQQDALEYLDGVSTQVAQYRGQYQIEVALGDKLSDEDKEYLKTLSTDQKANLALNIEAYESGSFKDFKEWADLVSKEGLSVTVQASLSTVKGVMDEAKGGNITKKQADTLFADQNFADFAGMSEEAFLALDPAEIAGVMSNFTQEYSAQLEQSRQKIISDTKAQIKQTQNEVQPSLDEFKTHMSEALAGQMNVESFEDIGPEVDKVFQGMKDHINSAMGEGTKEAENLIAVLDDIKNEDFDYSKLDDNQKQIIENFKNEAGYADLSNEEFIKQIQYLNKMKGSSDVYSTKLKTMKTNLSKAEEAQVDMTVSMEECEQNLSDINEKVDALQSSYKSLKDVTEQYNKNGFITMDQLQSLMQMDTKYLSCLEMKNGALSVNKESYIEMTKAQLDLMEAEAVDEAISELQAIARRKATDEGAQAAIQSYELAKAYGNEANLANEAAKQNGLLAQARAKAEKKNSADTKKVMDALNNKLTMIENMRANLGSNFDSIMGASSKSSSKKDPKELNKEKVDKYKQLELAIDRTNDALGRLQDREDHLSGKDLIKNLEAQTKQYVKQAAALTRLSKAASKTAANLKKQGSIYKNISYDKEGNITQSSYEAEFAAQQKAYNDAIEKYNASAKEEADEKALEKAEESWNNFKDWVDDYDEACQKVDDTLAQLMQNIQDTADANLKKFDITFDVKLNTEELNRSWSDFQKKYQKDFKKLAKATLKDIQDISSSTESYNRDYDTEEDRFYQIKKQADIMNEIYGNDKYTDKNGNIRADKVEAVTKALKEQGVQYTSMADLQKDLEESFQALQDSAENVFDSLTEAWDTYLDSIDDIIDGYDDIQEEFQEQIDDTEYYCELIEMMAEVYDDSNSVYEQTTAAQISMNATKMDVTKNQISALNDELTTLKEMQDTMQEGDEDWEKLNEQINKVKKSIQEQTKAFLEAAKAKKQLEDEKAYKDAEKALTGGTTFSARKDAWDQAMADQDRYYDSTERLYQLQSMAGKYDTAINNKGYSLKAQKQLNDLKAKELDYLKKKEKLSKDDIEMAEKRYQIAIAQADLENAQNNKNSMKVTRNAQGNWTYQYVADDEDVEEKQQALSDAYNDLYVTAREAYQSAIQLAMEAQQEYLEKFKEINEDTSLTAEQRQQKLAELEKEYSDRISMYMNDAGVATQNMMSASTTIIKGYFDKNQGELKTATDEMQKLYNGVRDAGVDGFQKIFEKAQNISDPLTQLMIGYSETSVGGFLSIEQQQNLSANNMAAVSTTLLNTLKQNDDNYAKAVEETLKMLGLQYKNLGDQITDNGKKSQESYQKQQQYSQKAKSDIAKEKAEIEKLTKVWNNLRDKIEKCKTALDTLSASTVKGIQQITAAQIAADKQRQQAQNALQASSAASSGGAAASQKTWELQSSTGGLYRVINKTTREQVMIGTKEAIKDKGYDSSNTEGLKTGGYTGEWDNGSNEDNGKLAFLHQKELVLNEKDTANFLDAINTVRDITSLSSSIGDTIISSIAAMLTKALTGIGGQTPIYNNDNTKDDHSTIVYNVEADFSGVSSKEEIIAAFKELPNLASQYVNEKHR